ncbi:hypothetical protein BIW11_04243 [Tropilaelaps mercedesae]|uniref:Uncharacterized protein n=1 Tax=Tropilaelaps mercedesae TaxID=418985 RepID=A0A1V9X9D8_9ACAR|nr:hypothetical protein BIW11_04243 [Tropilaelaps mercedesae]
MEASSRRPMSSTHSYRIRPRIAAPSPLAEPRQSLIAPAIQNVALSNEVAFQGPQVVGVVALPRILAGHDAGSRFYPLPGNAVNLEQLRSKHGHLPNFVAYFRLPSLSCCGCSVLKCASLVGVTAFDSAHDGLKYYGLIKVTGKAAELKYVVVVVLKIPAQDFLSAKPF